MNKLMLSSALFALIFCSNAYSATDESQLTYFYNPTYSGGAKLTLYNNNSFPVTISQLNFSTNAGINTQWGTLWGYKSTLIKKTNPDGINTDYTINEDPIITIPPNQSAILYYEYARIGGSFTPYNAAMDPTNVSVEFPDSSKLIAVTINGACNDCKDPGNGKRIMGYYPDWAYWRKPRFTASQLPFDKINAIANAFSIFDNDGKVSLYDIDSDSDNLPIIAQARLQYPYLNASLSFGGWSWASKPPGWICKTGASPDGPAACFSQLAANSTAREKFITNAVQAMKEVHFNGIDIDWEYPTPADANNYVLLLQGLHDALTAQGEKDNTHYYLTIAAPAGIDKIRNLNQSQWQAVAAAVDYIDVMTYDFHGAWDQGSVGSDFMAAMKLDPNNDPTIHNKVLKKYNVTAAMKAYLNRGISANKLVVGIPVYGRMVEVASSGNTEGLYQTITGTPQGEWDNQQSGNTGMLDYKCIVDKSACGNNYSLPDLTLVDPTTDLLGKYALTPWGFSPDLFVTYEDAKSAANKAQWILDQNFAGAMLWDFSSDFPDTDQRSIVNSIQKTFDGKNSN